MVKLLGIDSNYDVATSRMFRYRNEYVYDGILARFNSYEKKQENQATRSEIAQVAPDREIKYITGSGHGFYNSFMGHKGEEIWRKTCPLRGGPSYAKEEVENKIIHLLSCCSADVLGPDMVKKGCLAFFGYTEDFWVKDQTAELCVYSDSQIDEAVSEGENAEMVYLRTAYTHMIAQRDLVQEDLFDLAAEIQHNLDNLRCPHHDDKWGKKHARIVF